VFINLIFYGYRVYIILLDGYFYWPLKTPVTIFMGKSMKLLKFHVNGV